MVTGAHELVSKLAFGKVGLFPAVRRDAPPVGDRSVADDPGNGR